MVPVCTLGLAVSALVASAASSAARMAVQLCACDPNQSASQQWVWGAREANDTVPRPATMLAPLRLKARPDHCLFKGWGTKPTYLYVDQCSAGMPLQLSFRSEHNPGLIRDDSVLTDGEHCVDADGMSQHLQLYRCEKDDDDQQYAAISAYGLIVDLWTGASNCVGVVNATDPATCRPPTGTGAPPTPPTPPAPAPHVGAPSTAMSPRYHMNDGANRQSDPSGCIQINGTWFVFPDGSASSTSIGSVYTSVDLVHWTRRPTNMQFHETGGIGVNDAGFAVTFGSGYHYTDLKTDPFMSHWTAASLGDGDPHVAHGLGGKNVFRNGDPARPFKYKGEWYIVLGAGKNRTTSGGNISIAGCPLCNVPWMQGELRLYKATNTSLTDWHFVNVLYATNQTAGRTLLNDNTWASEMRDCPTCPAHSVSNMFECPDFFPIGAGGKWMFVTSKILQGSAWVTGGQHHWDEYLIGDFNGTTFTPDLETPGATGVLDYGYVAAGKTGGNEANDPMGRRVFFGWNMPWSRQGANGANGPWRRRQLEGQAQAQDGSDPDPTTWPTMEPFGSQVLPRDLSLWPDGSLRMAPVPELALLRKHQPNSNANDPAVYYHAVTPPPSVACLPVRGRQLEIQFTVQIDATGSQVAESAEGSSSGSAAVASISVLASPDGRERTLIGANETHLLVNQMESTLTPDLTPEELKSVKFFWDMAAVSNHTILHAPLPRANNHTITAYLDGYNLEVFADERVAITTNLFPSLNDSTCVGTVHSAVAGAAVRGRDSVVRDLTVWALNPAPISGVAP